MNVMFSEVDQQRKRKTESNENEALEKKQRVEQLVTALSRADRKSSSGSLPDVDMELPDIPESPNNNISLADATTNFLKNVNLEELKDTVLQLSLPNSQKEQSRSKPVAKIVHFSPKIIQVESMVAVNPPFTKARKSGGFAPPQRLSPTSRKMKAPRGIIRVPRDSKVPLIVYNPPRYNNPPPISAYPTEKSANLIINAPFNVENRPLPTLIPTSSLQGHFIPTSSLQGMKPYTPISVESMPTTKLKHTTIETPLMYPPLHKQIIMKKPSVDAVSPIAKVPTETAKKLSQFVEWSVMEVYEHFLNSDCSSYADIFREQEIDGKALLHLDEMNISKLLGVKMGPAIKLFAIIRKLKNCAKLL